MSRSDYAERHKLLGLCRNCTKTVVDGGIHSDYHRETSRIRGRKNSKKAIVKLKNECLENYGKECKCCGERLVPFLTIDHEEGNGNIQRKKLFGYNISGIHMYRWLKKNGFSKGFQILCMNCNWSTRYVAHVHINLER